VATKSGVIRTVILKQWMTMEQMQPDKSAA
jgi:hypothetical protein